MLLWKEGGGWGFHGHDGRVLKIGLWLLLDRYIHCTVFINIL